MAAATTTASYSFTDDDVSRLAKCDDQPEFLLLYRRLLQSKGIDPTAVFDAKTTLGSPSDYGAAVLPKLFENTNRDIFAFNMGVDSYVLEPVAKRYKSTVPDGGRRAIDNHLEWASMPSTALNSTLQGEFENAALATIHFAINGLTLGFADLTETPGAVDKRSFDQTLARSNVPDGHYLMVPVLGSHSSRSLVGRVVDTVTNPLLMIQAGNLGSAVRTAQIPARAVAFRANNFAAINDVKYNSIDPYARTRSLYFQSRAGKPGSDQDKNKTPSLADDQFDAFFDETIQ